MATKQELEEIFAAYAHSMLDAFRIIQETVAAQGVEIDITIDPSKWDNCMTKPVADLVRARIARGQDSELTVTRFQLPPKSQAN